MDLYFLLSVALLSPNKAQHVLRKCGITTTEKTGRLGHNAASVTAPILRTFTAASDSSVCDSPRSFLSKAMHCPIQARKRSCLAELSFHPGNYN